MTCSIVIAIQDPDTGNSMRIDLADDFDTVFNKVFPLNPPSSSLEHRANCWHNRDNGTRIAINPGMIAGIEEHEAE